MLHAETNSADAQTNSDTFMWRPQRPDARAGSLYLSSENFLAAPATRLLKNIGDALTKLQPEQK